MVRAGHGRPGRGLGAGWVRRLGQLGQFWCTVHLARFLDPVRLGIFLSHQMNTLHGKINFRKFFFLLNSNKNQINFDKIFEK